MGLWFRKNLGDAMLAFLVLEHVESTCLSAYKKAQRPNEMAVFLRHESEGLLQCEVIVYFSPAMAPIAGKLGATPCEQPTKYGLSLLVGDPIAWSLLIKQHPFCKFTILSILPTNALPSSTDS